MARAVAARRPAPSPAHQRTVVKSGSSSRRARISWRTWQGAKLLAQGMPRTLDLARRTPSRDARRRMSAGHVPVHPRCHFHQRCTSTRSVSTSAVAWGHPARPRAPTMKWFVVAAHRDDGLASMPAPPSRSGAPPAPDQSQVGSQHGTVVGQVEEPAPQPRRPHDQRPYSRDQAVVYRERARHPARSGRRPALPAGAEMGRWPPAPPATLVGRPPCAQGVGHARCPAPVSEVKSRTPVHGDRRVSFQTARTESSPDPPRTIVPGHGTLRSNGG